MAVLKCKMCGGNLEFTDGQSYGTCDSCGSTMTLPKANDERVLNLFNRANHYRIQNEFDKALATYESILEEDSNNAEAYWGCVLSRYGIEYVEDVRTHERIPTCHRVQNESILADLDYKKALEYAPDTHSRKLYENEAEKISEIQKGILNIARSEKPYDIFICYKETDALGQRTIDSTLAQDIYYQLTNEGYKVFFSRITLEDKLGQEYEPYIFAALNSAKVMLVVGTKSEYFNAIWVKNEWARFLDLTKKDKSKLLIPCYREMDAYELPEELSMFQSQDMGKIGFIQDLIRGINKLFSAKAETAGSTVVHMNHDYSAEADALLKRAFLLLEEAQWNKADELLEKVLNINPENAQAYLGKLMIELRVTKEEYLGNQSVDFRKTVNYDKIIRFADNDLKARIEAYKQSAYEKKDARNKADQYTKRVLQEFSKRIFKKYWNRVLILNAIVLVIQIAEYALLGCKDIWIILAPIAYFNVLHAIVTLPIVYANISKINVVGNNPQIEAIKRELRSSYDKVSTSVFSKLTKISMVITLICLLIAFLVFSGI